MTDAIDHEVGMTPQKKRAVHWVVVCVVIFLALILGFLVGEAAWMRPLKDSLLQLTGG